MLLIKFDQDWPTVFRDIQVWKCGRRRTTDDDDDDGRRTTTDGGPLVYYKLTLWAFGSGELKMQVILEKTLLKRDFHAGFSADVNSVVYQTDKH